MSDEQFSHPIADAPCDSCKLEKVCKQYFLACDDFAQFVAEAGTLPEHYGESGAWRKTPEESVLRQPSRKMYRRAGMNVGTGQVERELTPSQAEEVQAEITTIAREVTIG